jgi:hypothetical protein
MTKLRKVRRIAFWNREKFNEALVLAKAYPIRTGVNRHSLSIFVVMNDRSYHKTPRWDGDHIDTKVCTSRPKGGIRPSEGLIVNWHRLNIA